MHGGKLPRYLNQLAHFTPLRTEIVTKRKWGHAVYSCI